MHNSNFQDGTRHVTAVTAGNDTLAEKHQLVFTPCKAEQPLQGMELQGKEAKKKVKAYRKSN